MIQSVYPEKPAFIYRLFTGKIQLFGKGNLN
jgi:hypothetical protein